MEAIDLINIICPEHSRTSCSDENIDNGFYFDEDMESISIKHYHRCNRCALLEIENNTIKLTEQNSKIIPDRFSL